MGRVLIVDDTAVIAHVLAVMLKVEGFDCIEVTDDFRRLFSPEVWEGVDVLICDVRLTSNLTGVDVMRYAIAHHPDVYRIAVSSSYDRKDLVTRQAHQACHVFLRKPTDMIDLVRAVKERVS